MMTNFHVVTNYFKARMPKFNISDLGFREKLWLYKSHLWYSFLVHDFVDAYKYASKWVDLFERYPAMISLNPVFFLKGNHYLLESLFLLRHHSKFKQSLGRLDQVISSQSFPKNDNIEVLCFLYVYNNKLNLHFMEGTFKKGIPLVDEILSKIDIFKTRIDEHHIMLFYYKIASLYFGAERYKKSIEYLTKIIENKSLKVREDLMCFSRILNLIAHYEAGLDYSLEIQLKSTFKFLIKMNELHEVQKEVINFLKNLGTIYPHQINKEFKKLHERLKELESHPYERRAFLYLDIYLMVRK